MTHDDTPGRDPRFEALARGDAAAARSLVVEVLPRVRNLARYFCRHDSDADDVAQQALLEILRAAPSFRGEGTFTAFSDRIVARIALGSLRRTRLERARTVLSDDVDRVDDGGADASRYIARRRAVAALDALPDEQRAIVVLHHVLGTPIPEAAEELGIPFETARSRLRLALRKLRDALDPDETSDDAPDARAPRSVR